jgi:imidazolonepropionase-like amidohydrolase
VPLTALPEAAQVAAQFLPASYLVTGFQGLLIRNETLLENWPSAVAMTVSLGLGLFVSTQLFRWDKEDKVSPRAKLWVVAVLGPFLLMGAYEAQARNQIRKNEMLWRQLHRNETILVRGARIFVGDGRVIESGGVLISKGKIQEVYEGVVPNPGSLNARAIEAAGKTVLPGLIDVHVHLAAPGGFIGRQHDFDPANAMTRALASYLYCGITAVKSVGDPLSFSLELREKVDGGERLGAELFACGPLITTPGGHGTEFFEKMPASLRAQAEAEFLRLPATPEEAREQVKQLAAAGVDGFKAVLDAGQAGMLFERMDPRIFRALAEQALAEGLPLVVHTGDVQDVREAIEAGVAGIEHGSFREPIPDDMFAAMARRGIAYDPTLSVLEAFSDLRAGKTELLGRTLVQQVGPPPLLEGTREALARGIRSDAADAFPDLSHSLQIARDNLVRAHRAGVALVCGSDAGNPLVIHGPTIHRELQLWVEAGIAPQEALRAATHTAAKLLRADGRIGLIAPGHDADLLLVDGNPLEDIHATERISGVIYKGEEIQRTALFQQD